MNAATQFLRLRFYALSLFYKVMLNLKKKSQKEDGSCRVRKNLEVVNLIYEPDIVRKTKASSRGGFEHVTW